MLKSLSVYYQKNVMKIGLYGFMCGMSLLLSGNTLNFWLASYDIDAKLIGLFSLIVIPYVFKFLIAIIITKYQPLYLNRLGRYKAWLILAQSFLAIILFATSFLDPKENLALIALSGFLIALFAVIQDITLNYDRIKMLDDSMQSAGTAIYTIGYRLGMLFSGAGVIFLSVYFSWNNIFLMLSGTYLLLTLMVLYCYVENTEKPKNLIPAKWYSSFTNAFQDFLIGKNIFWIIMFILIYRLSDHMLVIMLNPFLLHMGYSALEIASISKFFGIIMVIIGGIISGPVIAKLGIRSSLIGFSIIHIGGNLLFILLSMLEKNIPLLYLITAYEALTGGMMMTAYLFFISSLCKGENIAAQYALLSSGMGLSRAIFPSVSGVVVDYYGWTIFFVTIALISAASAVLLYFIPKRLFK